MLNYLFCLHKSAKMAKFGYAAYVYHAGQGNVEF